MKAYVLKAGDKVCERKGDCWYWVDPAKHVEPVTQYLNNVLYTTRHASAQEAEAVSDGDLTAGSRPTIDVHGDGSATLSGVQPPDGYYVARGWPRVELVPLAECEKLEWFPGDFVSRSEHGPELMRRFWESPAVVAIDVQGIVVVGAEPCPNCWPGHPGICASCGNTGTVEKVEVYMR